jgi:hypothetical protein
MKSKTPRDSNKPSRPAKAEKSSIATEQEREIILESLRVSVASKLLVPRRPKPAAATKPSRRSA